MPHVTKKWTKEEIKILLEKKDDLSNRELAELLNRSNGAIEKKLSKLGILRNEKPKSFTEDTERHSTKLTFKALADRYKDAIEQNLVLKKSQEFILGIKDNLKISKIEALKPTTQDNEATMVVQWSDWHIDEVVTMSQTNGLNAYNPDIATRRLNQLFQTTVRFINIWRKDITIPRIVIQLGGDFISGNIHDELKEHNSCGVMTAGIRAINYIATGLTHILDNVQDIEIICVCNAGNHSRITPKQMISTESDNSLETFIYYTLQDRFPQIKFIIDDSYLKYLDIYGWRCRFHHGHFIQYGGGIGGIFIPIYKKIAQWNKGKRVDYDFIDHFHQSKDGGNCLVNGSVIGFSPYAIRIGADYEVPKQNACLIDKKRGKTMVGPIILD